VDSGKLDVGRRFFLPCTLYNSSQDLIGTQTEDLGFLQGKRVSGEGTIEEGIESYDDFADKTDCLERGDFEVGILLIVDKTEEELYEISPLIVWELDCGNGGDDLGGKVACLLERRCEGFEGLLLDLVLCVYGELQPPIRVFLLPCRVLERGEAR